MNRSLVSLGLACWLASYAAAAPGRAGSPSRLAQPEAVADCFRGDKRLSAPIEVAEKDRPLGEWLRSLGATLNVKLAASREASDHKLTLLLDRRPAAEALTLAARHLSFEWSGGKNGYTLLEGDKTRAENDRRRREQWRAIQLWMERLARLSALPPERINARRAEVEQELKNPGLDPVQRSALLEEQALFRDLSRHSRAFPVVVRLYQSLRAPQLEQLRSTGFLRLSSAYGGVSPEVVAAPHQAFGRVDVEPPPDAVRHTELCLLLEEVAQDVQHPNGARQLRLRIDLTASMPGRSSSSVTWRLRTPPAGGVPTAPALPAEDPDLKRMVELNPSQARPALDMKVAGVAAYTLQSWKSGLIPISQIAEAFHAQGLDVASDSFIRARLDPSLLTGKKSLGEILTLLSEELDVTWRKEGRLLLLSSRSRVFDRDAEAPDRVIRPFRARMLTQPSPTLDDFAQLAANLTDSQCRGLTDCWGWYFEGANIPPPWVSGGLYEARHHLRLWGSLTPTQRREAIGGQLSVDAMSGAQKRLCGLAISAPGDDLNRPDSFRIPTPQSLPHLTASFGLGRRQVRSQAYRDDEGRETADITPLESAGFDEFNYRRFGGRPRVPMGPATQMQAYDFIYYVSDGTVAPQVARSVNLHLVPRWP
ncbi:MAG: hypothetical protein ACO1SX_06965 [Actinomycetota bacterium]